MFFSSLRNCIGQTFAMNEMKVAIAMTLKKYELIEDPALKPKIIPRLVLRSLNGIHIKIKSVNREWRETSDVWRNSYPDNRSWFHTYCDMYPIYVLLWLMVNSVDYHYVKGHICLVMKVMVCPTKAHKPSGQWVPPQSSKEAYVWNEGGNPIKIHFSVIVLVIHCFVLISGDM